MKGSFLLLFVLIVVLAISVNSAVLDSDGCDKIIPAIEDPVCAYNGKCYKVYGNAYLLEYNRCSKKEDFKEVNMELCDTAKAKPNPDVKWCYDF